MTQQLLVFREYMQKFYQKNSSLYNAIFRFLIGVIVFFSINQIIGYDPRLNHFYVEYALALISILMSGEVLLFAAATFVVLHILYVSQILAVLVAVFFAILYFAYIKFVPKHAYIILAFPITFSLNLVWGVPVLLGLLVGPASVVPIICGVSVYYLLQTVTSVLSTSTDTSIGLYQVVLRQFIYNEEMYAIILVFSLVSVIVYLVRTQEWDFAFDIAILAGSALNIVSILIVNYFFDININLLLFLAGAFLSILLVWMYQFMHLPLNYAGVEKLQFEDEEYYYYVRAVPKMNIAVTSKHVKHFNRRSHMDDEDSEEEKTEETKNII